MDKPEYIDYLEDILEAGLKSIKFVENYNYEMFAGDDKTMYAVIHALEIIGEAARNIP